MHGQGQSKYLEPGGEGTGCPGMVRSGFSTPAALSMQTGVSSCMLTLVFARRPLGCITLDTWCSDGGSRAVQKRAAQRADAQAGSLARFGWAWASDPLWITFSIISARLAQVVKEELPSMKVGEICLQCHKQLIVGRSFLFVVFSAVCLALSEVRVPTCPPCVFQVRCSPRRHHHHRVPAIACQMLVRQPIAGCVNCCFALEPLE